MSQLEKRRNSTDIKLLLLKEKYEKRLENVCTLMCHSTGERFIRQDSERLALKRIILDLEELLK